MSLDTHLQASTLVGFVDKFRGASNFLTDRTIPTQATRNFICRTKSKKESLPSRFISDVARLLFKGEIKNTQISEATHVVVGVIYGAEAYCVLAQDLNERDQDDREDAEKKLFNITAKMKTSLEINQDVSDFKEQFDNEEKQLSRLIKCCVYSDLRVQPVRECKVLDAYKHCYKLVEEIQKTDGKNKAVVLAVLLCPLENCKIDQVERLFRNVDSALITRCCYIWEQLENACALAEDIRTSSKITNRASLRQFEETILKYQQLLKASWKTGIGKARQNMVHEKEVERVIKIAEAHPLFRNSRLERWLCYKKAEVQVAGKMSNLKGISLVSQNQLKKELGDSFDKKYALVLSIPPLDERTNEILFQMAEYVNNYASSHYESVASEDLHEENNSDEESRLPWHMVQHKRKQVLAKIRELVDHVEKNKHLIDQVRFFITPRENGKGYWCRYSVYEAEILIKDSLAKLPMPPTNIRIHSAHKAAKKSIRVEWDYCDLGYPCCFLVEYRKKHSSESWTEQKTMKPGIHEIPVSLRTESVFELRVTADTCIGRSEFSDVIDIDSHNLKPNPKQMSTEEQSVAIVYESASISQQSSEIQLEIERNHDLWNWIVKESGVLANMSSLSPLEVALRQFCTLLEPLGNQIDQLYTNQQVLEDIKRISNLLDDVTDWLVHRRREVEKISSLLNCSHLSVFDLAEIEARKPLAFEKYAKIFILKVNYIQDPLIDRICKLSRHPEPPFKLPVFPFITYEEKRLEFIAKTLYTFSAIESIASRLDSNQKDTTYQIGLTPVSSSPNDGTITTMNYSRRAEDTKPTVKTLRRTNSVSSIRINSPKVVQSRLLLELSLKDIRPELEACFVDIENMELFRRAIVKTTRNCSVQKSEMRFVKVDCADGIVAYNCCRCEKTCKEPVKIKNMNLDKFSDGEKLCTRKFCRCPEKDHVFQQFEWRHQAVKITTTLADMKKEFETNRLLTTTEDLLAYCAEELEKIKVKVLNLLEQVSALSPESTASVYYLIQLLKSEVIRKQQPDYLVRWVTLSNLQAGDSSKIKAIRSGSCGSRRPLLKCYSSFDEAVPGSSKTRSRAE